VLTRIALCMCFAIALSGCATKQTDEKAPTSTTSMTDAKVGNLLPVGALRDDLVMKQSVSVRWQDREENFEAVLQKRGSELLLLGLGPMNTVGFSLTLDDRGVTFENRTGRELPFLPERILADVQRVFYPWIEEYPICSNCEREAKRAGLEIRERMGDGFLEERRFSVAGRPERGELVVRYEGWIDGFSVPRRAILSNGWFGYELIIDTASVERID
jgi:hypothetical protein